MERHGPELWSFEASATSGATLLDPLEAASASSAAPRFSTVLTPSEDSFRTNLRRSAKWHLALLVFVIFKSLVFPEAPKPYRPALRVDLVGLPDLLKKDLSKISPSLPPQDSAESAEPAEEAPPAKAEAMSEKEPETADPGEMVLKKKPESIVEKNRKRLKELAREKEADTKREKKMREALARVKSLQKIRSQADTPKLDAGILIRGNQLSKGTSLSGDASEQADANYLDLVRDRLQQTWELPVWLARQNLSAKVEIHIDPRGLVRSYRFLKASGNAQFDEAVKRTITQAQPFPRPPEDEADSLLAHGISLGFPL